MKLQLDLGNKSWLSLILEGLMVLIGVLLALMVDEWREDRQIQSEVDRAVERLNEEVIDNYNELVSFQNIVADRLQRLRDMKDKVDGGAGFNTYSRYFDGYRFAVFNDAAWRRASSDRIANHMDADYLEKAFGLYNWNRVLNELDERANELIYSAKYFEPKQAKIAWNITHMFMWQQDIWAKEMLDHYREFLALHAPETLNSGPDPVD